ncbi:MAG TPA: glycosyltransferase [Acidimicrobiia bacterium]|nr:glycosyltransferase [Acidimicrobiia bacterium]
MAAIVVTHNNAEILDACLDSLTENMQAEPGLSVVVVDNRSSDDSSERARAHPVRPRVVVQDNLGYAAGINAGIAVFDDDTSHVLVLNPDVRLERDAVTRLVDSVEKPGVGIAVPRMVDGDGQLLHSLRREPTALRALGEAVLGGRASSNPALGEVIIDPYAYERPTQADWATGAAMLISAECRHAVGPWDERYFLYSEETDFALRARNLGYATQLVPEATATHLGGDSSVSPRLWSILTINRIRLQRRRKGLLRTIPYALGVTLFAVIRALAGRPTAKASLKALSHRTTFDPELRRAAERSVDYVLFAGLDWWYHSRAHSDFQLLQRIARTRDVLVVNAIGMRMPMPGQTAGAGRRILRKLVSITRLMRKPVSGLFGLNVISPLVVPWYGHRLGRAANAWIVAIQVRIAAFFAGITRPVVIATLPTAVDVIDRLPKRFVVYNRSDKHSAFAEADQEVIRSLEERLLRVADLIVYSSHDLMEEDRPFAEGRQMFLDHGVDLVHFDPDKQWDEPEDIREIPRPRVGFFGGLADYVVDFDLIRAVARELPNVQVVLIGDQKCSDSEILQMVALPNLTWLGFRPYEEIPAYGAAFDVAIMPWQDNEWIRRSNPIKLKEYLALGLPVVSTYFPELARYSDVVSVAHNQREFIEKVEAVLRDGGPGTPATRRAAVADASWDRRARDLMAAIEGLDDKAQGENSMVRS